MVTERLDYTKVSQSSGLPADNSELMSRSKFTRDIGGGSANKDILGKNSDRVSEARSRFSSPKRTNRAQEAGKPQRGRGRGASGERGRSRTAEGGIAPRVSLDGLSCPPAIVESISSDFPLRVPAKLGQKRPFLPRSSRLLPPSHAAAASSVLKLPTTTEGVFLARRGNRHLGGKEG